MEGEGKESKVKYFLSQVPNWLGTVISIGGLVFSMGILYNDVQTIKQKVAKTDDAEIQQAVMASEISSLHVQIEQGNKTQEQTNIAVGKLTDSVSELSVAVGRLQGKLDDTPQVQVKQKKK